MISMPVASFQSARVAAGSASPAATRLRSARRRARRLFARAGGHRAVRGRRGGADGRAMGDDRLEQVGRAGLLEQHRRCADVHREHRQAAQPEGEGERRAADEDVIGRGAQHVRREADAARHHVAVEVHRRLRLAGGARGEREQAVSAAAVSTFANGASWRAMRASRPSAAAASPKQTTRASRGAALAAARARRAARRRRGRSSPGPCR